MKNLTIKLYGLFFLLIVCNFFSQEINSMRFENILKESKVERFEINHKFCTEKKIPNSKNLYIVVLPIFQGKKEIDDYEIRNLILITDEKGNIKNRYFDPVKIKSDLDEISEIKIDTGLYSISDKIRAFGVKIRIDGPSRVAPYFSESLTLYYPSGKTMKKILNQFPVRIYEGDWDERCSGKFKFDTSNIIIDKIKTNGFANLKIKTETSKIINKPTNDDCKEIKSSKISYKTLKFSNGTYQ